MNETDRDTNRQPADIEREIGHTRVELELTLDAIERKLNPRYLVQKGLEMTKDSLIGGEAVNRTLAVVRNNPLPCALIALGTAWLIAQNTGASERVRRDARIAAGRRRLGEVASDASANLETSRRSASDNRPLGHTGNPVVDTPAKDASDGWVHQVSDMAQDALRTVRDSGEAVISRAGAYAGDGASVVADHVSGTFERHPLLLGAFGAVAGTLIASLLPLTRAEEDLIGSTRDEIWHRAEAVGQEAVARVREAASNVASRAADAAAGAAVETIREELTDRSAG